MRVPILSYQTMFIHGNAYAQNHLRALAADLRYITEAGYSIRPLRDVVDAWLAGRQGELEGVVALTCDDSGDFAWRELDHPTCGKQPSLGGILRDFQRDFPGKQPRLNVTTFEVASPEARADLDRVCLIGRRWWTDSWWREATASGLVHVGNHSWDHNHEAVSASRMRTRERGTFAAITSEDLADFEIRQAREYLDAHVPNPGAALFAYPYSEPIRYLVEEYFGRKGEASGAIAAFTGQAGFIEAGSNRWSLPRFRCGRDWSTPEDLGSILEASRSGSRPWIAAQRERIASAPADIGAFDVFLRAQVESIPGWLLRDAALLTAHLTAAQRKLGLEGAVLEIGVYQGKYLAALCALAREGEPVVGVDLFVGGHDAEADARSVKENIDRACGAMPALQIHIADSLKLDAKGLARRCGVEKFRFVSIDGGHTREVVLADLRTAWPMLAPGAIVALDDVFNFIAPGVGEGIAEFVHRDAPAFAPFAICGNKVFVTTPDHHARYLEAAKGFLDAVPWLPSCARARARRAEEAVIGHIPESYGHEVVVIG